VLNRNWQVTLAQTILIFSIWIGLRVRGNRGVDIIDLDIIATTVRVNSSKITLNVWTVTIDISRIKSSIKISP